MAKRKVWHQVHAPKMWRPKDGAELIGEYIGSPVKVGEFGEYKTHLVKQGVNTYYATGSVADSLFALVQPGMVVKVVYVGKQVAANSGNEYKQYELFTEEEVRLSIVA